MKVVNQIELMQIIGSIEKQRYVMNGKHDNFANWAIKDIMITLDRLDDGDYTL